MIHIITIILLIVLIGADIRFFRKQRREINELKKQVKNQDPRFQSMVDKAFNSRCRAEITAIKNILKSSLKQDITILNNGIESLDEVTTLRFNTVQDTVQLFSEELLDLRKLVTSIIESTLHNKIVKTKKK